MFKEEIGIDITAALFVRKTMMKIGVLLIFFIIFSEGKFKKEIIANNVTIHDH